MHRIKSWLFTCIVGAFALGGAQLPKITQDYQRQYKVRFSELRDQVVKTEERAQVLNEDPMEYIQRHFLQNTDDEVVFQGRMIEENLKRFERMRSQLGESDKYREWVRPFYWLWSKDAKIAQDTWKSYQFGFIYSPATLIWAVIGAGLGGLLLALVGGIAQSFLESIRRGALAVWRKVRRKSSLKTDETHDVIDHDDDFHV